MKTVSKKVLVTGATGFLGVNILRAFDKIRDVEVVAASRNKTNLPDFFHGEVREGDLCSPEYRKSVVNNIDVICHAGTWASMWGHTQQEKENFYDPTIDLIEQAIDSGVKRFLMTSTVAMNKPTKERTIMDDFSKTNYTGFWPHVDFLIDIDQYMKLNAARGMQMTTMRLGHFIGAGNKIGLLPALVPRLKTYMVPWLSGGKSRLPLIADTDLGDSYVAAVLTEALESYESFNICGGSFPTAREVIEYVADKTGAPKPIYSVPYSVGYMFAWLMESLFPILPGKAPFLTRSIVHLSEDWECSVNYAETKLGYRPNKHWKIAVDEALEEMKANNYSWPFLEQA